MHKCTLCHENGDCESPTDPPVYERNPETFRKGWMHVWCLRFAIDDLTPERRDAYMNLD